MDRHHGIIYRGGFGTVDSKKVRTFLGMLPRIGVSKYPGAMVLQRIRISSKSREIGRVIPFTPPVDAAKAH